MDKDFVKVIGCAVVGMVVTIIVLVAVATVAQGILDNRNHEYRMQEFKLLQVKQ